MTLLAAVQAIDLRGNVAKLATKTGVLYTALRAISKPLEADRRLDSDIAMVSSRIADGSLPFPALERCDI